MQPLRFLLCIYWRLLDDVQLLTEPQVFPLLFFVFFFVDLHVSPGTTEGNVQNAEGSSSNKLPSSACPFKSFHPVTLLLSSCSHACDCA